MCFKMTPNAFWMCIWVKSQWTPDFLPCFSLLNDHFFFSHPSEHSEIPRQHFPDAHFHKIWNKRLLCHHHKKKRKIREKLGNWCADYESWAERVLQEAKSGYKKKASVVSARQRLHRRPMSSSFFQQRRADDGYLVFRPSLKLRNRTRLRLFSSSFLAWNSPWILKPRCTTKAVLSTENLYPATWSSQAWREIKQQHEKTDVEVGSDESERGEVREDNDTGDGFGIEGRRRENKGERADMRKERWNVFFRYEVSGRGCVERWNRQRCGDISTGERRSLEKEGHEV